MDPDASTLLSDIFLDTHCFELEANDLLLHRTARPGTPFDKVGRRFAILGDESGSFEAWAYPLKLIRGFTFSFFIASLLLLVRSGW